MNQFVLGALVPFAVATAFYLRRRGRASLLVLIATPLLMAGSGVWAIVPDLPRLMGWSDLYWRLSHDPRTNLFWWHYAIDQIEGDSTRLWEMANIALIVMFAGLLAAAWRELRIAEKG